MSVLLLGLNWRALGRRPSCPWPLLHCCTVALKKQPPGQIQAAYWTGALSKADDAQWIFRLALIFRVLPKETLARSQFAIETRNIPELGISENKAR
jgi:hypothetical protein